MPTKSTRPAARLGEPRDINRRRGFATMDPALQRQIASKGGKASAASGRGHKWTSEAAQVAGRKGGITSRRGPATKKN